MAHDGIKHIMDIVWNNRDKSREEYDQLIDSLTFDINYVTVDSLYRGEGFAILDYNHKFEQALYKIRPRFPVLHSFLKTIHALMKYSVDESQKPSTYNTLIMETLKKLKEKDDLGKITSVHALHSFVYTVIMANMVSVGQQHDLNNLFGKLAILLDLILSEYRKVTPLRLWFFSPEERRTANEKYDKDTISERLSAVVDLKKKQLGEKYGRASNLVGQATTILLKKKSATA